MNADRADDDFNPPQPMQDNLVRMMDNMASASSGDNKRRYDQRTETPKTQPTDNDIGRTVLEFGENIDLRNEAGVDDINAEDMCMEFGSFEEDDNNNRKKAAEVTERLISINDTTNFARGKLLEVNKSLVAEYDPMKEIVTMRLALMMWANFAQEKEVEIFKNMINDRYYYTKNNNKKALELELEFNTKRDELIELIKKHLPEKYHGLINMGTKFSILTRILHKLHYSPEGTTPDPNDPYNHSPFFQCCIATMMTKLLNFLINEDKLRDEGLSEEEIVAKMSELMSYGGNPKELNQDLHTLQAVIDLIFFDLKKKKKKGEMEKQYDTWADRCNLNSKWELFTVTYNTDRLHMLLFRAAHPDETLQVHCASAPGALYGFELKAGVDKYATKIECTGSNGVWYVITFGGHPQTYLMGLNKSLRMFPEGIREIIAQHLIELFSNVYEFKTLLRKDVSTCLMDVFGGTSADGVNLGEYSHLARLFEEAGLLDLKEANLKSDSGPTPFSKNKLITLLKEKGWDQADIERLRVQLKEANDDFDLMMRRMKQFRAGARLHYIAAQLLELGDGSVVESNASIPPHITTMIEEVNEVLQQNDVSDTWKSLVKIQKNQLKGGKRLVKLQQLAAKYNRTGNIDDDDLEELIELLADERTKEEAMAMIKGVALLQDDGRDRLTLLSQLAAEYNHTGGEVNKEELKKLLKLLKDECTEKEAMDMIEGIALLQDDGGERLTILSKLASLYNKMGGNEGEGREAIERDSRLDRLVTLMAKDATRKTAIDAIVSIANQCSKTFWENFNKLEKYRKDYPDDVVEVQVNGEMVKVLTIDTSRNNESQCLHYWLVTQNGHRYANEEVDRQCGIKAYERMGSIEQLALSGIDVTFDTKNKVHQKAMDKRLGDKTKEGVSEGRSGFVGRMFGNKRS